MGAKSKKKYLFLENAKNYSIYIILVWSVYRALFFGLPYELDELFVKPLFWITPIVYLVKKEKLGLKSLGFSVKKFFPSIYFVLAMGVGFALEGLLINIIKYRGLNFSAYLGQGSFLGIFLVSIVTAFTEEVSFRGYLFNRFNKALNNETRANLISSTVWSLVHLPIVFAVWGFNVPLALGYFLLVFVFGVGSSFIFARTENIFASVLLHVFWEWPIILFR
jgi:membrane protease YdiL (CAAX protease family)